MVRFHRFCAWLLWLMGSSGLVAKAQALDPTFQPTELRTNASNLVRAVAVQPDGKVLVAGSFDFAGPSRIGKVCRLHSTGGPDLTFNSSGAGANGPVNAVLLQPDGKILIAGEFTSYNGLAAPAVARLNADGTPDLMFTAQGMGSLRIVHALALQPDGKILAGGFGQIINGAAPDIVVRLSPNGSRDLNFALSNQRQLSTSYYHNVAALLVQPSGKIVVGGSFVNASNPFGTRSANNLARLNADGTLDFTFDQNAGLQQGLNAGSVSCLAQQADGKVLAGGYFNRYGVATPTPVMGLVRLEADGTLDAAFSAGYQGSFPNSSVRAVLPLPSGSLLAGGSFSAVGGAAPSGVAKVLSSGTHDAGFSAVANGLVTALAPTANGQVVLGGWFTQYDGVVRRGVARVSGSGVLDPTFVPPVFAVRGTLELAVPLNNGQLLVKGVFSSMNGTTLQTASGPVLRVNANGSLDATFSSPTTGYFCSAFANGNYYLATSGSLNNPGTLSRYSATGGSGASYGGWANWGVFATTGVTEQPDGKLLVYGIRPFVMGGNSGPTFYRFEASTRVDAAFAIPPWYNYESAYLQPDGKIIAFLNNAYLRLAADGTVDNSFARGGFISSLDTLTGKAIQPNGQMLVSGTFSQINGSPTPFGLVRLLPNGALDPSFSGVSAPYTVKALQPDGRILVTSGRGANTLLLRLEANGQRDLTFTPVAIPLDGTTAYHLARLSVALQPTDGKIILCGGFTSVAGLPRDGLARLTNTGLLPTRPSLAPKPLRIFPNPATQLVTVQLPSSATAGRAELLDLTGRLVTSWPLPAQRNQATLDLSTQTEGIYLLRLRTAAGDLQQKLVIRH